MKLCFKTELSLAAACLLLISCNVPSTEKPKPLSATQELAIEKGVDVNVMKTNEQWQLVTIKYMDFEGGFFGLVTEQGDNLLPLNLTKKYQQAGAIVKVQGQLITDMVTFQQWGTPFKITKIELIKAGQPTVNPSDL